MTEGTAWGAGLFEGEGSVSCFHSGGRHRLQASILMTDLDRLEAFVEATGLGAIYIDKYPRPAHYRQLYRWWTNGHEHSQALAAMLWPWLGVRRREQFRTKLECYRANSIGKRMENLETRRAS